MKSKSPTEQRTQSGIELLCNQLQTFSRRHSEGWLIPGATKEGFDCVTNTENRGIALRDNFSRKQPKRTLLLLSIQGAKVMLVPQNCKRCNSQNLEIRPGKGPHGAAVVCIDCESRKVSGFQKWLSKGLVSQLKARGLIEW
jgi:hypothetical protein